jgi:hypothetical protein
MTELLSTSIAGQHDPLLQVAPFFKRKLRPLVIPASLPTSPTCWE